MDVQSEILQQMRALKKRIAHLERLEKLLLLDEDDMSSNSATAPPSQQSVVEYVANQISSVTNQISPVKIVAVEYALFTGTQSAALGTGPTSVNITDLLINHALSHVDNKLILLGMAGVVSSSSGYATCGIAFSIDGTWWPVGASPGERSPVTAVGRTGGQNTAGASQSRHISAIYSPETTNSIAYRLIVINADVANTVYINRWPSDTNTSTRPRGVSGLILIEYEE